MTIEQIITEQLVPTQETVADGDGVIAPRLARSEDIQGNVLAPFNKDHQVIRFVTFPADRTRIRLWLAAMVVHLSNTKDVRNFNVLFSAARSLYGSDPATLQATWTTLSLTAKGITMAVDPKEQAKVGADLTKCDKFLTDDPKTIADALGDSGLSTWKFGAPGKPEVHAVVLIASDNKTSLKDKVADLAAIDALCEVKLVHQQDGETLPGALKGNEHFGFKDGISQPGVVDFDTPDSKDPRMKAGHPGTWMVPPGEFVLGEKTLDARPQPAKWLHNGSLQVVRLLEQDVAGWRKQSETIAKQLGKPVQEIRNAFVGRTAEGKPLAKLKSPPKPHQQANDFDYADDPDGTTTPCLAHIRKTNPRYFTNVSDEKHEDDHAQQRRRLARRGIPYGKPYDADTNTKERGLVFVAYCGSFQEQFLVQQKLWINSHRFKGGGKNAATGPDAMIGPAGEANLKLGQSPRAALRLSQFVHVRGAVYAVTLPKATLRKIVKGEPLTGK